MMRASEDHRMKATKVAPGFDGGLAWLNVDRPITMMELRGAVVIVDFWTYCCVNCMHVLPVLRTIEERFADEPVVVIGVHSGKFTAERDPQRIREAVGRYGVPHPVVVDDEMVIWSRFGVRSWPTLVIVRPDGTIASIAPGEPELETLDAFLRRELELARQNGTLSAERPNIMPEPPHEHRPLQYPGKVAVLPDGGLCVSDSGHHRVLVCDQHGTVDHAIGGGLRGWQDGSFESAAFDDPQGCCWHEGALYIADARNHCIRRADLGRKTVTTVAGTGVLGTGSPRGPVRATELALRSPWDLCAVGDAIYVAMAGNHQIWRFWPARGEIEVYAGTGVEALLDGAVDKTAWAQPSGLSEREGTLYVADSETSAIRAIDLAAGRVRTLVGEGLFDFGDDEGEAGGAMLQHCLGVAAIQGGLLIADTYNGKIKRLSPAGGQGQAQGQLRTVLSDLSEPGSVAIERDGSWIVADTNAHRVLRVRYGQLEEVEIADAPEPHIGALRPPSEPRRPSTPVHGWFTTLLELEPDRGLGAGDGCITLLLRTPEGLKLAEGSSVDVTLEVSRRSDLLFLNRDRLSLPARGAATQLVAIDVRVADLGHAAVESELLANLRYVTCDATESQACHPGSMHLRVPVRLLARGGRRELEFAVELPAPDLG
jgi:thiol-disulfide isomerase/thioredoxin